MYKIVARNPSVEFPEDVAAECWRAIREDAFPSRADAEFYLRACRMPVRVHLGISRVLGSAAAEVKTS